VNGSRYYVLNFQTLGYTNRPRSSAELGGGVAVRNDKIEIKQPGGLGCSIACC